MLPAGIQGTWLIIGMHRCDDKMDTKKNAPPSRWDEGAVPVDAKSLV